MNELSSVEGLSRYLGSSYTAFQAVQNAAAFLSAHGFCALSEDEEWDLYRGNRYYVTRGGSALIAFCIGERPESAFKIVATHTDSPALKLKENAALSDGTFTRLNAEPYGGGIYYTFFDRPLKIAGRIVREKEGVLVSEPYVSEENIVIPSLAIHMDRSVNEKFSPNAQTDLLPLWSLGKSPSIWTARSTKSSPPTRRPTFSPSGLWGRRNSEAPFMARSPSICSPPAPNSPFQAENTGNSSLRRASTICRASPLPSPVLVAACFDSEEVGSHTLQGAGSGFLKSVLSRIAESLCLSASEYERMLSRSFSVSLDNAHSLHPNHPEKCDPTNRAVMGGGVVIKGHAGGAYTTDALSSAVIKRIFSRADVKFQTFFNRSDMRSGGTLGAIGFAQVPVRTVDLGLAQLAMHSAVETFAKADYEELLKGISAFYGAPSADLLVH